METTSVRYIVLPIGRFDIARQFHSRALVTQGLKLVFDIKFICIHISLSVFELEAVCCCPAYLASKEVLWLGLVLSSEMFPIHALFIVIYASYSFSSIWLNSSSSGNFMPP
mmetsp:Transcript_31848/g.70005  ORF Transcript_31848/g.70005 Transcript_31848/m.70005 type:complete len:111 (-) Transcript_31848:171-503(-)